jgi:hypothetical protein
LQLDTFFEKLVRPKITDNGLFDLKIGEVNPIVQLVISAVELILDESTARSPLHAAIVAPAARTGRR